LEVSDSFTTLVTVLIGGALTQFGVWQQARWQIRIERARAAEVRAHEVETKANQHTEVACELILEDASELKLLLNRKPHDKTRSGFPESEAQAPLERILRNAVRLPTKDSRIRVNRLADIVWYSEVVASYTEQTDWVEICFRAIDAIFEVVGAILRGEAVPDAPSWFEQRHEWAHARNIRRKPA
jgi:hypothetical protein